MINTANWPAPPSAFIGAFAAAIAAAENTPVSWNNPGALALGDQGHGVGNSANVTIFGSLADGVNALYNQLSLIVGGSSAYETMGMTISEFAVVWTGNDNATGWASTVAGALQVSPMATLTQIEEVYDQAPTDPATGLPAVGEASTGVPLSTAGIGGFSWGTLAMVAGLGLLLLVLLPSDR